MELLQGSRMISHGLDGYRQDAGMAVKKTRFGGFFVVCDKGRALCISARWPLGRPISATPSFNATRLLHAYQKPCPACLRQKSLQKSSLLPIATVCSSGQAFLASLFDAIRQLSTSVIASAKPLLSAALLVGAAHGVP
jgi:hypothetical protein